MSFISHSLTTALPIPIGLRNVHSTLAGMDYFGENIQDDEDNGNDLFRCQYMNNQGNDYQDVSPSADPDDPSTNASPLQIHVSEPLPTDSIYIQACRKPANGRARNKLATPHLNLAETEDLGVANESSNTPETHTSQQTITPEEAPNFADNSSNNAPAAEGFIPLSPPSTTRRRQWKQETNGYNSQGVETVKRHKFLERNRVAATKCRQKKKEWVSDLEETRFGLESQHNHLQMEYSTLRDEITHIKAQLMDHAGCNDANIDKWIENEAKRFVLGAGERYDHMLANLGTTTGLENRQGSISSAPGYPAVPDSGLTSPITSSHRGSFSFPPGTFVSNSPVFYHPDMTPSIPQTAASVPVEEPYPIDPISNSITEDTADYENVQMTNETFQDPTMLKG